MYGGHAAGRRLVDSQSGYGKLARRHGGAGRAPCTGLRCRGRNGPFRQWPGSVPWRVWRAWLGRAESIGHGEPLDTLPDTTDIERRLNYLSGASMLVGRRFLEQRRSDAGGLLPVCRRSRLVPDGTGARTQLGFAPGAEVLHRQGTTTGTTRQVSTRSWLSVYLDERNKMLVTRRHYPARLPRGGGRGAVADRIALSAQGRGPPIRLWRFGLVRPACAAGQARRGRNGTANSATAAATASAAWVWAMRRARRRAIWPPPPEARDRPECHPRKSDRRARLPDWFPPSGPGAPDPR